MLAPIEVPLRKSCLLMTCSSLSSFKYLYNLIILIANKTDLSFSIYTQYFGKFLPINLIK